ncbi:hypothetical protein V2J09_007812 [Rumex salicifolius]
MLSIDPARVRPDRNPNPRYIWDLEPKKLHRRNPNLRNLFCMAPGVPSSEAVVMKRDGAGVSVCSNCKSDDRWILHNVHNNRIFRLLCTSCVLKIHFAAFCPICFSLHPLRKSQLLGQPPIADHNGCLLCFKCKSPSHNKCIAPNTPRSPYLCPTCYNPNSKLFDFCKPSSSKAATLNQSIDLRSAKALRAAAMIAANSLHEAADRAREVAEKKAKESMDARKKAKEELDKVASLWSRAQKEGNREVARMAVSNQNGYLGLKPKNSVPAQVEKKESFNNGGALVERKDGIVVNKVYALFDVL